MAWEWETTLGMDFGMGTGTRCSYCASTSAAVAQLGGTPSAGALCIDDVLDFSGRDLFPSAFGGTAATSDAQFFTTTDHSSAADANQPPLPGETNSSSVFQTSDFYIPFEEAAELDWLSQFVDDSYSDVPCHYTGVAAPFGCNQDERVNGSAVRSKRNGTTDPTAVWSSLTQPAPQASPSSSDLPSSKPILIGTKSINNKGCRSSRGKRGGGEGGWRRCTHCASEKTPQWRTGPLGPKTLCNACGVRYKSGRLVPEYRPAASPTFVLSQHSNSHRKVMELRRQKELILHENQPYSSSSATATATMPELLLDEYGVC